MAIPRLSSILTVKKFAALQQIPRIVVFSAKNFSTSQTQKERFYTKKHEWVNIDGSSATVGVSKYAADALGDVVYAQLPEPGDSFAAGDEIGALESVKAASEVYTPVSGQVTEKNLAVEDGPALINQSPEGEGWLFKLDLGNPGEADALMKAADYEAYLGTLAEE